MFSPATSEAQFSQQPRRWKNIPVGQTGWLLDFSHVGVDVLCECTEGGGGGFAQLTFLRACGGVSSCTGGFVCPLLLSSFIAVCCVAGELQLAR